MTQEINWKKVASALTPEAIQSLTPEMQAFVKKEANDPTNILSQNLSLEQASRIMLVVSSLLAKVPLAEDFEPTDFEDSLNGYEDKELVALLRKLCKLPCYALRKPSKKSVSEEAPSNGQNQNEDNPLMDL